MNSTVKLWIIRIIIILLAGFSIYKWGIPLYNKYMSAKETDVSIPTAKAASGTFTVSFQEVGTLDARVSISVVSPISGKVIKIVDDGSMIKKGMVIAELDTSEIERQLRDEKLKYENTLAEVKRYEADLDIQKEQNRTELEQAQTKLDFVKAELDIAKENLRKKTELAQEKLIAASEVDRVELDVRSKELEVKTGEMQLALKLKEIQANESQKAADLANKIFTSNISRISLEEVQQMLNKSIIRAPADGMVVLGKVRDDSGSGRRIIRAGDNVRPRLPVCQLPNLNDMLVMAQVGESDAHRLSIGMNTIIKLEAVPGKIYHGTLEKIASLAIQGDPNTDRGSAQRRKNFAVTIALKEHDNNVMKPGMTANVEFIEKVISNAIFVPLQAVFEEKGKTYIFIKKGDDYERVLVKTGISNNDSICILDKLKKGDIVALKNPISARNEISKKSKKQNNPQKAVPIPGSE